MFFFLAASGITNQMWKEELFKEDDIPKATNIIALQETSMILEH
jgi:hypothetical protein